MTTRGRIENHRLITLSRLEALSQFRRKDPDQKHPEQQRFRTGVGMTIVHEAETPPDYLIRCSMSFQISSWIIPASLCPSTVTNLPASAAAIARYPSRTLS